MRFSEFRDQRNDQEKQCCTDRKHQNKLYRTETKIVGSSTVRSHTVDMGSNPSESIFDRDLSSVHLQGPQEILAGKKSTVIDKSTDQADSQR